MFNMFKIGDIVRVSLDMKIIECVIIGEKSHSYQVIPLNANSDGKDRTFWVSKLWVMGF